MFFFVFLQLHLSPLIYFTSIIFRLIIVPYKYFVKYIVIFIIDNIHFFKIYTNFLKKQIRTKEEI